MPVGPGVIMTELVWNANPVAADDQDGTSVVYDHPAEVELALR
jgi:hypothetical protein